MSCHTVLEFDELRILNQLGHEVFCIGSYMNPKLPTMNTRLPLSIDCNDELLNVYSYYTNLNISNKIEKKLCGKILHKDFVNRFDCVIIMHKQDWIDLNNEVFKNKKVILRTIGQNLDSREFSLSFHRKKGIKVLRFSPKEREITNYAGEDGLIRFLKYKSDFKKRNENLSGYVMSYGQNISTRKNCCGEEYLEYISTKFKFKLFGRNSDVYPFGKGFLTYEQQLEELSKNNVFFYTGTNPAQYSLGFVEALLSGIPVVSIGELLFNKYGKYPSEVCDILSKIFSLHSNDVNEICLIIEEILKDNNYSKQISERQLVVANDMFSVEKNLDLWNNFLNNL